MLNSSQTVLAFCVQTAPDVDAGHRLYGLDGLDDADTARAMQHIRMQQQGTEDLPVHQQKITAIAVAGFIQGRFSVVDLGESGDESTVLEDFYRRISHANTLMLSYGGTQYLPILRFRGLMHGITGGADKQQDLAAWLGATPGDCPPLDEIMAVQALPRLPLPALSCTALAQTRAVQVYLLYLRYACWQGQLVKTQIPAQELELKTALQACEAPHWREFLDGWPQQ